MINPTPFIRAEEAEWSTLPNGARFLPTRVYLNDREPHIIVKNRKKGGSIIVGEHPGSGYSGIMLDRNGDYAGSVRRSMERGE